MRGPCGRAIPWSQRCSRNVAPRLGLLPRTSSSAPAKSAMSSAPASGSPVSPGSTISCRRKWAAWARRCTGKADADYCEVVDLLRAPARRARRRSTAAENRPKAWRRRPSRQGLRQRFEHVRARDDVDLAGLEVDEDLDGYVPEQADQRLATGVPLPQPSVFSNLAANEARGGLHHEPEIVHTLGYRVVGYRGER